MKILVYGAGVLGSLTIHELMGNRKNDVTVCARGKWLQNLESNGLIIHHTIQRKQTVDHFRTVSSDDPALLEHYDLVISVMQYLQQKQLADTLRQIDAPVCLLVGNNAEPEWTLKKITEGNNKQVLFGFQSSAGIRRERDVECTYLNGAFMTIGRLHDLPDENEKHLIRSAFSKREKEIEWCDDMEGWLMTHAAAVLPIAYTAYIHECNMRTVSAKETDMMISAMQEYYDALMERKIEIRPYGDYEFFNNPVKRALFSLILKLIFKTKIGDLTVTDHCRNAVTEMEALSRFFEELKEGISTPNADHLLSTMPTWERLHEIYDSVK